MALPSDLAGEIRAAMANNEDKGGDEPRLSIVDDSTPMPRGRKRKITESARRTQALSLKLAGLTYEQIADRLEVSAEGARNMVMRSLERAESRDVEYERSVENARLDRAQAAIWSRVLDGDLKALDAYLKISQRRAKLNGMDAPSKLDMSLGIRNDMEKALNDLEQMVVGEVIRSEVLDDND